MHHQKQYCLFDNLIKNFFCFFHKKTQRMAIKSVAVAIRQRSFFFDVCKKKKFAPISDRASITETVDLGSTSSWAKPKTIKNWYSQLSCLAFSDKKGHCEDSTMCCKLVNKWQLDSKTECPFALSWPRQLG